MELLQTWQKRPKNLKTFLSTGETRSDALSFQLRGSNQFQPDISCSLCKRYVNTWEIRSGQSYIHLFLIKVKFLCFGNILFDHLILRPFRWWIGNVSNKILEGIWDSVRGVFAAVKRKPVAETFDFLSRDGALGAHSVLTQCWTQCAPTLGCHTPSHTA